MNKDKSFEWNETIQKMQKEPILIGDVSNVFQVKKIINEQCKCGIVSGEFELKKHIWENHKTCCPIWKNGRIEELERVLVMFDSAFMAEDIYDLEKAHGEARKALKNEL